MDAGEGTSDRIAVRALAAVLGILALAALLGMVVLPTVQGARTGLTAWQSFCRAIGVASGAPTRPQPAPGPRAQPVSDVAWSPAILTRLANADRANGKRIVDEVCAACHGDGGLSLDPTYPYLAGQSAAAIYKQLHDYRNGARVDPRMTPVVAKLNDLDMADVAAFMAKNNIWASLGAREYVGEAATLELLNRGDPHRGIPACNSCHGRHVGGPIETPTLAGQHREYIKRQLDLYAAGARRNDVYARMRTIAAKLTPAEREALARAYQGVL